MKGAYVNMVALASNAADFRRLATEDLLRDELTLIEVEDLDTARAYRIEGRISAELEELIAGLSPQEPVKADVFAPYASDDS